MTPRDEWMRRFSKYYVTNGYAKPPWNIYNQFRSAVTMSGSILEIACGNGLLLRYVSDLSDLRLEPYGIDINADAIREAKLNIFPNRQRCFVHGDLREGIPFVGHFDSVLANPLYADPGYYEQVNGKIPRLHFTGGMRAFIGIAWNAVAPGGQLILWCYDGHYAEIAPQIDDFRGLLRTVNIGLEERDSGPVVFWASSCKPQDATERQPIVLTSQAG